MFLLEQLQKYEREILSMKKKLLLTVLCISFSLGIIACSTSTSNDYSDANVEELQERIEELEDEIARLKGEQGGAAGITEEQPAPAEQEILTDDTVISFTDQTMLEDVRNITGVTERDITYGDVKNITEFNSSYHSYSDLSPLRYFTSLVELDIEGDFYNLNGLEGLTNLKTLIIDSGSADNLTDISAIANLTNLETLEIIGFSNLTDISVIGNLTNLQSLLLYSCGGISDISAIGNLTNLQSLRIISCDSISDIGAIGNLMNLQSLEVNGFNGTDISALGNLTNLQTLGIYSCDAISDISMIGNLSNLRILRIALCDNITQESIDEVMNRLPDCKFENQIPG